MNKKIKIILSVIGIFVLCLTCCTIFLNSTNKEKTNTDILYETTYSFGFGSRSTRVYTNGDVFDDLEIENPKHKPDYKYVKTLTADEIADLMYLLDNKTDDEVIKRHIIELVYGVSEFDDFGNYDKS